MELRFPVVFGFGTHKQKHAKVSPSITPKVGSFYIWEHPREGSRKLFGRARVACSPGNYLPRRENRFSKITSVGGGYREMTSAERTKLLAAGFVDFILSIIQNKHEIIV